MDCNKCKFDHFCCSFTVKLTEEDIKRIQEKGYEGFYIEDYEGIKTIKLSNHCHFLENGRCKIYEIRPKPCRDFPNQDSCSVLSLSWKKHQKMLERFNKQ